MKRYHCSAMIKAPVGPHGLDDHHLGKVLAREEADEGPVRIGDGQCHSLRSVEPVKHGLKRGRSPYSLDGRAHKSSDCRLTVVALQGREYVFAHEKANRLSKSVDDREFVLRSREQRFDRRGQVRIDWDRVKARLHASPTESPRAASLKAAVCASPAAAI